MEVSCCFVLYVCLSLEFSWQLHWWYFPHHHIHFRLGCCPCPIQWGWQQTDEHVPLFSFRKSRGQKKLLIFPNFLTVCKSCIHHLKSLGPGRFEWNLRYVIFNLISLIDSWGMSYEIYLKWMSLDVTDNGSTLVQVMACCCQATSHYQNQC